MTWLPNRGATLALALLLVPAVVVAQSRLLIKANERGNLALSAGQYEEAIGSFSKALDRAEDAGDAQYRAMAMYGLARANANLCRVAAAEQWFRDSIALRETIPDEYGIWLTQNYSEFARFLRSQGRTAEAVEYFGRAVPKLEAMGFEQMDPIGYANYLDDYVGAMKDIGMERELQPHAERAAGIRLRYPGRQADFRPAPYPVNCGETAN